MRCTQTTTRATSPRTVSESSTLLTRSAMTMPSTFTRVVATMLTTSQPQTGRTGNSTFMYSDWISQATIGRKK